MQELWGKGNLETLLEREAFVLVFDGWGKGPSLEQKPQK